MDQQKLTISARLEKHTRHESLTKEEMQSLDEWRNRSAEHCRIADLLADKLWVKQQLQQMSCPSPHEEMWAFICKETNLPLRQEQKNKWLTPLCSTIAKLCFRTLLRTMAFFSPIVCIKQKSKPDNDG